MAGATLQNRQTDLMVQGIVNGDQVGNFVWPLTCTKLTTKTIDYSIPVEGFESQRSLGGTSVRSVSDTSDIYSGVGDDVTYLQGRMHEAVHKKPYKTVDLISSGNQLGFLSSIGFSVKKQLMIEKEEALRNIIFAQGSYNAGFFDTPSFLWDTLSGKPYTDILNRLLIIKKGAGISGLEVDMVVGDEVDVAIRTNAEIIAKLADNAIKVVPDNTGITNTMLANLFGVRRYIVGVEHTNTTSVGETPVYSKIWGKNVALINVGRLPRDRHFIYDINLMNQNQTDATISSVSEATQDRWFLLGKLNVEYRLSGQNAGFLLENVIS